MRAKPIFLLLLLVVWCISAMGQDTNAVQAAPSSQVIGAGDIVNIRTTDIEDLTGQFKVTSKGELSLSLVGYVPAAGLTAEQLEADLTQRLKKFVKEPQVSVFLSESKSRPVVVAGAVKSPGEIQIDETATLLEVIAKVGGTQDPGPTVTVTRPIAGGAIVYPGAAVDTSGDFSTVTIPVTEVLDGSTRAAKLLILPHDTVTVSTVKAETPKVYIAGDVVRPGMVELVTRKSVSLTTLVAVAGGTAKTAKPSEMVVVHHDAQGRQTDSETVDFNKVLHGKQEDFSLVDGDIVFVPSSKLKTILNATATSLASSGLIFLGRL